MSYKQITDFASKLRRINGLYLFNIFMKYINFININSLFNYLATNEKEADLRKLEKLWDEFMKTGDITINENEYSVNDLNDDLNENKKTS